MAQVVWTEPALNDLDAIADYIALEDPAAAKELVRRVFGHVEHLAAHPKLGSIPPELSGSRYRQLVEPPCRILCRSDRVRVFILFIVRAERRLDPSVVAARSRRTTK